MLDHILKFTKQNKTIEIDPMRFRPIDTLVVYCDNRLIREKLGWKPQLSVFDALGEMVEAYLR